MLHDEEGCVDAPEEAPEVVHINQLSAGERTLDDARMLVLPGGFSYGDDLGAGKLWSVQPDGTTQTPVATTWRSHVGC